MQRNRTAASVLLLGLAGCGGGGALPARSLTPAEAAVCTALPTTVDRLAAVDLDGHNAALGIPSRALKSGVAPLVSSIDALDGETDSPLRKPMLTFRKAAGHIGPEYVDDDDVINMIKSTISAQGICERMDARFLPRPRYVKFPGVRCPGGRTTVEVDTKDSDAFDQGDSYYIPGHQVAYGDLSGDGIDDVVGSFLCETWDDDVEESPLESVVVMTRGRDGAVRLGQPLPGYFGEVVDGQLKILVKNRDATRTDRYYRVADGRWSRVESS